MEKPEDLIEEAQQLFKKRKFDEAFHYYNEAAMFFRAQENSSQAAECFAKAAQCEKVRIGIEPLLEAAHASEMAAQEALKIKDYAFARWQFREASTLYEREGDFEKYSRCFVQSQDAYLEYLWHVFCPGEKQTRLNKSKASVKDRLSALGAALLGIVSKCFWGYGERPFQTVLVALTIILGSACAYRYGGPMGIDSTTRTLSFFESLYMSGITFSTLGYGDIVPVGWLRFVALIESISGFVMVPMFVIALTRRYLRAYR